MKASKPLILVVDDEALVRFILADTLEDEGFAVAEAANAENALGVLKARPDVRLLLTDIQMPGAFDGLELVRRVHKVWPRIGLMVTSGQVRPHPSDIPEHGRFLAKPYSAEDLLARVHELVG